MRRIVIAVAIVGAAFAGISSAAAQPSLCGLGLLCAAQPDCDSNSNVCPGADSCRAGSGGVNVCPGAGSCTGGTLSVCDVFTK